MAINYLDDELHIDDFRVKKQFERYNKRKEKDFKRIGKNGTYR